MSKIKIDSGDALIVVDVQPTFMLGGGLAVKGGDEIVDDVHDLMDRFEAVRGPKFATLDRHPRGHISLASSYTGIAEMYALEARTVNVWDARRHRIAPHAKFALDELKDYLSKVGTQVLWPDHAIAGSTEAELHPDIPDIAFDFIQVKGMDPTCDSYSGFYDNLRRPTGFGDVVAASGAKRLFICGLAFDFCVGWTALDAVGALPNCEVFVIEDACRSVDMPGTVDAMKTSLKDAGVQLITNDSWL